MAFLVNSLVFLLIGIEVHVAQILESWWTILLAIGAVLLGRLLVVYCLSPLVGRLGEPIPMRWNPVMVWGGLHGSVSIALALSLPQDFPARETLLTLCFGVVAFSIVAQGLTMKPLLAWLKLVQHGDSTYSLQKARQLAVSASRAELEHLRNLRAVSPVAFDVLSRDLEAQARDLESEILQIQEQSPHLVNEEIRQARLRLLNAERSALQRGTIEGLVSQEVSEQVLTEAAEQVDRLSKGQPHG
jgi:CPA1 family monovalent cation:H+ antiporter